MGKARAKLSLKKVSALIAHRVILHNKKLVYVLVANKKLKYKGGSSKIAYIGTTKKGGSRIAQSVAARAPAILRLHGITRFEARVITCPVRQKVKMWRKLERALLLEFKAAFNEVPRCNVQGKNIVETNEFKFFSRAAVRKRLVALS